MIWVRLASMGAKGNACRVLGGNPEGMRNWKTCKQILNTRLWDVNLIHMIHSLW
jgi:hypothetical protein